ncbi:hypothetical protein MED01_002321 [Micromonospora sp. MED01]|uniref:hypothetical protein n=1 Tax=Micromonospora alfalfae TaxID=2911212 RepID=UPI001EE8FF6D|nr:hypothetical protein [Micromonospora alfalfae]MCG5464156.1 hypothetical protein [Micromonospora alfalfae]
MIAAAGPVADASTRLVLMWLVGVGILLLLAMWLHSRINRVSAPRSTPQPGPAWGDATGSESTLFPTATEPPTPTRADRLRGYASDARTVLRGLVGRGDRFAESSGKHTHTQGWSPREVRRQLEARADLSEAMVAQVQQEFIAAGLPPLAVKPRAVGVAQVVERPSWDDINRKRAEQDAWLADPDRTGWMPLVPTRRDGAR